jgi:hypothetical protein
MGSLNVWVGAAINPDPLSRDSVPYSAVAAGEVPSIPGRDRGANPATSTVPLRQEINS